MQPLPIDAVLERVLEDVRRARALVLSAQPGSGKTTRIPPALAADGPVVVLQPRRVAARAIAARIADERQWTLGHEVGWQVRFEQRFTPDTRVLVVTEGVLTARLQRDPLLSDFRTVVFDEFHERSVHSDLAIALGRQAWRARDDLRVVVMSATLDTAAVSAFLDGCPVLDVPGRAHPLSISYAPGRTVADVAAQALADGDGDVLCFLPGAGEIRRAIDELTPKLSGSPVDVLPLHGSLDAAAQDAVMRPGGRRRVVVATNIAETSVTVPGVRSVVDSGLQKIARYDAARAIDSLDLDRITADAADQRAGRAARLGPGQAWRLWHAHDRLRAHREAEIHRIDLSGPVLDILAAGWDARAFEWFEPPEQDAVERALLLLVRLGLVEAGRLTPLGEQARQLPLHPRLARALLAAHGARDMARAAALLSERHVLPPRRATTTSDLLSALDDWPTMPTHVQRVAAEIERQARRVSAADGSSGGPGVRSADGAHTRLAESAFLKAVFSGYPDRVAERRAPGSPRARLSSGVGATLGPESGVHQAEFFVALDIQAPGPVRPGAPAGQPAAEARIRLASGIERAWLTATSFERIHRFDAASGTVKASILERYEALVLAERTAAPDGEVQAGLLAKAWLDRGPLDEDVQLLRRLRFAGHAVVIGDLVLAAARLARSLDDVKPARALSPQIVGSLAHDAPDAIMVPSGRRVPLEYDEHGAVSAAVKLQELFGLQYTPRVGVRHEPVLLALLAPNGRPVQLTRDLHSFWTNTYPEVRRQLRGRYPRHPWPEDPRTAVPTGRVQPRRPGK